MSVLQACADSFPPVTLLPNCLWYHTVAMESVHWRMFKGLRALGYIVASAAQLLENALQDDSNDTSDVRTALEALYVGVGEVRRCLPTLLTYADSVVEWPQQGPPAQGLAGTSCFTCGPQSQLPRGVGCRHRVHRDCSNPSTFRSAVMAMCQTQADNDASCIACVLATSQEHVISTDIWHSALRPELRGGPATYS